MEQGLPSSPDVKSPKSFFCQHQWFDLLARDEHAVEGNAVWFHCMLCLMTVKKVLIDESEQL